MNDHELVASVIVCTHNRAGSLDGCLRSILDDPSTTPRELILVDNASSDGTEQVVHSVTSVESPIPIRYIREPRLGKSNALNTGIAAARGRLLLFTDDDVLVEDGWADALCAPFLDPRVGAVGGRIKARWPFAPPKWMNGPHADHLSLSDWGAMPKLHDPAKGEFPCGANMAIRAALIPDHAPFDPALGPTGNIHAQYEEYVLLRGIAEGNLIPYAPQAVVHHVILAERVDWGWLRRSYFQGGFGQMRYRRMQGDRVDYLHRRVARSARAMRQLWVVRRRSRRLADPTPDDAWVDFVAHAEAGQALEALVGRFPRISDRLRARLGLRLGRRASPRLNS